MRPRLSDFAGTISLGPMSLGTFAPSAVAFGPPLELTLRTTSVSQSVSVPARNTGVYNAVIDWGDGSATQTVTTWNSANLTHVYAATGDYNVTIAGFFPALNYGNGAQKLTVIAAGGTWKPATMQTAFYGCANLTTVNASLWDVGGVSNFLYAFFGTSALTSINTTGWDVSAVTAFDGFSGAFELSALNEATVDAILARCVAGLATGVTLDLYGGTNATPSAAGLANRTTLLGRGWTVNYNFAGDGVQLEGFQGLAVFNSPIPDQIDISLEGFQGLAVFNSPIPDQIDISLEGFQGLVIAQIAYP